MAGIWGPPLYRRSLLPSAEMIDDDNKVDNDYDDDNHDDDGDDDDDGEGDDTSVLPCLAAKCRGCIPSVLGTSTLQPKAHRVCKLNVFKIFS